MKSYLLRKQRFFAPVFLMETRARYVKVTTADGPGKGEWVACLSELKITFKSGKSVMIWANSDYQVENGKIVKTITLYNESDALRQMGFLIVAPE
jgi:uncharacterized protein (UPF0371 family)